MHHLFSKFARSLGSVLVVFSGMQLNFIVTTPAWALPGIEDCPSELQTRLIQAKRFLIEKQRTLADDFEIDARRGQERRSRRQILRRIEKMNFTCKADNNCDAHTAVQGTIVGGNRIRMCAAILAGDSFCEVVEMVAHEFGHNAHIPRARVGRHNRRGHDDPDSVYQFGYFARELCKVEYGMGFDVGDGTTPRGMSGLVAPKDIVLFPRKRFEGNPIHLSVMITTGAYGSAAIRQNLERYWKRHSSMNDLRHIGFDDNISSVQVNRGRWEMCVKSNYEGKCIVIDSATDNLSRMGMNNKISSIRYLGD